jgi:hypothetical protein
MPYYYEGVTNSEEDDKIQHEAFYNAVQESTKKLGKNSRIMTKEQYKEIIKALSTRQTRFGHHIPVITTGGMLIMFTLVTGNLFY